MSASRPHPRRAIVEGTEAHYRDAEYYDRAYRHRREDARFYADLARRLGGPVLELGAGTARVTIEIARAGLPVVGVDRMEPMLARARERVAKLPRAVRERIELRRGDLLRMRLGRRFPLVVAPFNVLMHLYARRDWERALATVRAHLGPGGRFVFDVMLPYPTELAYDPARVYRGRPVRIDGQTYRYGEAFHYDPVSQVQLVQLVFEHPTDEDRSFVVPLAHRQLFPAELEVLLHYNGFEIVDRFGDFARGPLDAHSESQVLVCRARDRAAPSGPARTRRRSRPARSSRRTPRARAAR